MTEPRDMEPFEARFAGRVLAYTDRATERRIDALAYSRNAMSSPRATGWQWRRRGPSLLRRPVAGVSWAVVLVVVALVGVAGVAVVGQLSDRPLPTPSHVPPAGGPIPEGLRHPWQRPIPVLPGPDTYGGGSLVLANGTMDVGRTAADASRSVLSATGDTLVATATSETTGCASGDVGTYRWLVEGKGTFLTLTAIATDACAVREKALAGPWVRSDLPVHQEEGAPLQPGTYLTSAFNPFDTLGVSGQLSYTVPEGWKVKEDLPTTFLLHHLPDDSAGPPSTDTFVWLFSHPRLAADFADGAACGPFDQASGVGHGVDDLVAAITARPGVVSTPPAAVTIGGYHGQMVGLSLDPAWTEGCRAPEGPIVGVPLLVEAGSENGPSVGLGPDHPVRLILLDLADGRTMSITMFSPEPSEPAAFDEQVGGAMPIIESFAFHPLAPQAGQRLIEPNRVRPRS